MQSSSNETHKTFYKLLYKSATFILTGQKYLNLSRNEAKEVGVVLEILGRAKTAAGFKTIPTFWDTAHKITLHVT